MASKSRSGAKTIASVTAVGTVPTGHRARHPDRQFHRRRDQGLQKGPGQGNVRSRENLRRRLHLRRGDLHLPRRQGLADLHRRRGGVVADLSFRIERFPPHRRCIHLERKRQFPQGAAMANHRSLIAGFPSAAGASKRICVPFSVPFSSEKVGTTMAQGLKIRTRSAQSHRRRAASSTWRSDRRESREVKRRVDGEGGSGDEKEGSAEAEILG